MYQAVAYLLRHKFGDIYFHGDVAWRNIGCVLGVGDEATIAVLFDMETVKEYDPDLH